MDFATRDSAERWDVEVDISVVVPKGAAETDKVVE